MNAKDAREISNFAISNSAANDIEYILNRVLSKVGERARAAEFQAFIQLWPMLESTRQDVVKQLTKLGYKDVFFSSINHMVVVHW